MELVSVCVASDLRLPIFSLMSMRNTKATKNDKIPSTIALSISSSGTWSMLASTNPPDGNYFRSFKYFFSNSTNLPTVKNIKLPMKRKIFSAYVGLDFESMHLNGKQQRRWTIAESENVCHDNFFSHSYLNQEWANYTNH